MRILQSMHMLVGKPGRHDLLIRFSILIAALCMSGPALLRWWRALMAVL